MLFSAAAVSPRDVWAVGQRQDKNKAGTFRTLAEHWNGRRWTVVPTPNPGATGNSLFGVAAAGPRNVWAVGQANGLRTDTPLAEHWNGRRWTVVRLPSAGLTGSLLQGVAIHGQQVWAVGQSDDAAAQARPLVEHLAPRKSSGQQPAGLGSGFSNVTGVAIVHRTVWLVGSALDRASGNQLNLVARNTGSGWRQVAAPNPGNGDRILGGISAAGGTARSAGAFDGSTGRNPLIMVNPG